MPIEVATYISDLVVTNPVGSESKGQGDDHIRLVKSALKATFPSLVGPINFGDWATKGGGYVGISAAATQLVTQDGATVRFNMSGGAYTYTLLAAATAGAGFTQTLLRDGNANLLTLQPAGAETINGLSSFWLGPNEGATLVSTGMAWHLLHTRDALAGDIRPSGAVSGEAGWLNCDGAAYSRSTYARLFAAIAIAQNGVRTLGSPIISSLADTSNLRAGMPISGMGVPASTTILTVDSSSQITMTQNATSGGTSEVVVAPYGVGDGTTTFNVPDFKGRGPIGRDTGGGLTTRVMGTKLGAETHALTSDENGPHTHTFPGFDNNSGEELGSGRAGSPETDTTNSSGLGTPHNNMQPSLVTAFRIKF